ncbi:MAG: hypothetical protein ABIA93_04875 [Candidatus Woesearchaeota archaeon]
MAKKDIPTAFWAKWLDSNTEERIRQLKTTMLVTEYSAYLASKFKKANLKKGYAKDLAARHFNDYLTDLEMAILSRKGKA